MSVFREVPRLGVAWLWTSSVVGYRLLGRRPLPHPRNCRQFLSNTRTPWKFRQASMMVSGLSANTFTYSTRIYVHILLPYEGIISVCQENVDFPPYSSRLCVRRWWWAAHFWRCCGSGIVRVWWFNNQGTKSCLWHLHQPSRTLHYDSTIYLMYILYLPTDVWLTDSSLLYN